MRDLMILNEGSATSGDNMAIDWHTVDSFWAWSLRLSYDLTGSVTSGPRTVEHNASVGGHPKSRHLWEHGWGCACDFVFSTHIDREEARTRAAAAGYYPYVGADYGKFRLHVQAFAKDAPLEPIGGDS